MLQVQIPLDKQFNGGISPISLTGKNQAAFTSLVNIRPTYNGMFPLERFTPTLVAGTRPQVIEVGMYPYIFNGSNLTGRSTIYSTYGTTTRWSCADFYNNAFFSSPSTLLYVDSVGGITVNPTGYPKSNWIHNCNGQIICAGILDSTNNLDESCVMWSEIGSSIFTVGERNTSGYRSFADIGSAKAVYCPTGGTSSIVLCSNGCTELIPSGTTFGRKDICNVGPRDEWSHCLAASIVYFIDTKGNLWQIGEGKGKVLGYSQLFYGKTALGMFFSKKTEELFIPILEDGLTYVLNQFGMYSINGLIYGVSERGGVQTFYMTELPNLTDAIIIDSVRDFKDPGMKVITEVVLGVDTVDTAQVSIYTRTDLRQPFIQSQWYALNEFNAAKPFIGGLEFKVSIKIPNYTDSIGVFNPDWMNIQYIKNDRRFNRGHNFTQGG
jgi:hypothetical protein